MPRKRPENYSNKRLIQFSQGLKNAFNYSQMSVMDLCNEISITRQNISHYLNAKAFPSLDTLIDIADAMGVSVDFLLGRTNDPSNDASTLALREILPADTETYDYLRTHRYSSTQYLCELLSDQSFRTLLETKSKLKTIIENAQHQMDEPVPEDNPDFPGASNDYWATLGSYIPALTSCIADILLLSAVVTDDAKKAVLLRNTINDALPDDNCGDPPEKYLSDLPPEEPPFDNF